MRTAFFRALMDLAEADERITLVVGDLGFGAVEPFARRFPDRFVNAGVAEQNMTGLAMGMALSGRIVFTYSIANFPTLRCLEQIRNDICYHRADVKIVAVGGGLAYGSLGMTHHATEDLAIMRALPELLVVAPGDPVEVEQVTRGIAVHAGPCYMRLGRAGEPLVHEPSIALKLGRAIRLREGRDVTLISTGGMLDTTIRVGRRLARDGIDARVVSMHTLKPLDETEVLAAARETGAIATLEEHSVMGGLGSAVAEVLAEAGPGLARLVRLGLPTEFVRTVGNQEYLLGHFGLSEDGVLESIRRFVRARGSSG
jgi:transketolase